MTEPSPGPSAAASNGGNAGVQKAQSASQLPKPQQQQASESKSPRPPEHIGWIQWTNTGKMYLSKKEKNVFVFEGASQKGFSAIEFKGTEQEQKQLKSDNWALNLEIKTVPCDVCPNQDVGVVLDCVSANTISSSCDFLLLRINTHRKEIKVENFGPKNAGMVLFSLPNVSCLKGNSYFNLRIQGSRDCLKSIGLNGHSITQNLPFHRVNKPTHLVGVACYGKTRVFVRRFKIEDGSGLVSDSGPQVRAQAARNSSESASALVSYAPPTAPCLVRPPGYLSTYERAENDELDLMALIERDIVVKDLQVSIDDIGGLELAKRALQEAVVLPILMPDFFTGIRQPWRGVLLFGPPGTGKTMLAKAISSIAVDNAITFFNCSTATLTSKWRGESEKLLRALFTVAKNRKGSILFFDEVDSLLSSRGSHAEHEASRRFKSEFLIHMDGLLSGSTPQDDSQVPFVMCTSNAPWDIDDALRRRLEKRVYIPLPDLASRTQMIHILLKELEVDEEINADEIARQTDGYSGSDLRMVMREAAMTGLRRLLDGLSPQQVKEQRENNQLIPAKVSQADIQDALQRIGPSVSQMDVRRFEQWAAEFGST